MGWGSKSHFWVDGRGQQKYDFGHSGSKYTGLRVYPRGWDFGVRVVMEYKNGEDQVAICLTTGSKGNSDDERLLGKFTREDLDRWHILGDLTEHIVRSALDKAAADAQGKQNELLGIHAHQPATTKLWDIIPALGESDFKQPAPDSITLDGTEAEHSGTTIRRAGVVVSIQMEKAEGYEHYGDVYWTPMNLGDLIGKLKALDGVNSVDGPFANGILTVSGTDPGLSESEYILLVSKVWKQVSHYELATLADGQWTWFKHDSIPVYKENFHLEAGIL